MKPHVRILKHYIYIHMCIMELVDNAVKDVNLTFQNNSVQNMNIFRKYSALLLYPG